MILKHSELHGYKLMNLIFEKTGFDVSPGSIYPILNDLEEKGYLQMTRSGRKKIYRVTNKGKGAYNELKSKHQETRKNLQSLSHLFSEYFDEELPVSDPEKHLKNAPKKLKKQLHHLYNKFIRTQWSDPGSLNDLMDSSIKFTQKINEIIKETNEVNSNGRNSN
ncbi:MAG: PadR family transcriptional regulator [Thermotogota bacterium]|nr:PadR family transcriptional regulator [Thermotogota bacterium]